MALAVLQREQQVERGKGQMTGTAAQDRVSPEHVGDGRAVTAGAEEAMGASTHGIQGCGTLGCMCRCSSLHTVSGELSSRLGPGNWRGPNPLVQQRS